ncbi:ABC transporter related protein [Oceanithermus profundus DSM 14977]|uniref:ABC transporter related protein n=1 Tax=Oceanithermus profundus (strain DSM 14977 / NBRC 100410 / VKM B-2274 / 506) TaxID=670487 RepID=E4U7A9_OCEP5|nr:ABC transporter ATP-binding protein [Oceanithermus profundus]ADR36238.1 ABC transporter related protein [Oceanithermus profundus DSM 14977]
MVDVWALKAEGLTFRYAELELFEGLDLELEPGAVRAVLGPSGSGKTTLVHLLAGILPLPSGRLWWGEVEVSRRSEEELARLRRDRVGLVFQHHYLLDELTALENVLVPGMIAGRPDPERARRLIERVGLAGHAHQRPDTLSGGERQRVAVARALYPRPRVVLADEPTGALDRANARKVKDLLLELAEENGAAVLLATHDEALVEGLPAWRLEDGRLVDG